MMPTPMAQKNTLKNRPNPSTTTSPPYSATLSAGRIRMARAITDSSPAAASPASHSLRSSGRNRSTVNTRKASPASANSGVSRCRLAVNPALITGLA